MHSRITRDGFDDGIDNIPVVLDTASTDNFIVESLARKLGLELEITQASLGGVGGNQTRINYSVSFTVGPYGTAFYVKALVLPQICGEVEYLPFSSGNKLKRGELPKSARTKVDVLLGVSSTMQVLKKVKRLHPGSQLYSVHTSLGHCVVGEDKRMPEEEASDNVALISNRDLERQLGRFCALETIGIRKADNDEERAEEVLAEQQLHSTIVRGFDGRYQMPLLFKPDAQPLRNNYKIALTRLLARERKLSKDPELRKAYNEAMSVYFERGDAEVVKGEAIIEECCYYIPHNLVQKTESETTKNRIVFDASCKNQDGLSLNSQLLRTPAFVPRIPGILLRFRRNLIALTADISKMFLQFPNRAEDRKYHRFLWRESPKDAVKHCALTTMTFGIADSPYKAIEGVRQHVKQYQQDFPLAVDELSTNLYVDDLLSGGDTVDTCKKLQSDTVSILAEAKLPLRKWVSNSEEVMRHIPSDERGNVGRLLLTANVSDAEETEEPKSSALGIEWDVKSDSLVYSGYATMRDDCSPPTKRSMASLIARLFDPMGYIAPFIILAKKMLQELWLEKLDWDSPLPESVAARWQEWQDAIPQLAEFSIPRQSMPGKARAAVQQQHLHCYGDASDLAMGTAIYLVSTYDDGSRESHLLMAKTKVCSLKEMTLARKELCAALMTAKLAREVAEYLSFDLSQITCYTDSMTTLQWIKKRPQDWLVFVANRCKQIQDLVPSAQWRHTAGETNPADMPSRGKFPSELASSPLWLKGPPWLELPESEWPPEAPMPGKDTEAAVQEKKRIALLTHLERTASFKPPEESPLDSLWKISSYSRFLRATAAVFRFTSRPRRTGALDISELEAAERYWIRRAQSQAFPREISSLRQGENVPRSSRLSRLTPFLDKDGLLRLGGRMQEANLPYDTRHPVILPAIRVKKHEDLNSSITARIINDVHLKYQHAGIEWLVNGIRDKFWIISGRRTIRSVVSRCIRCQRAIKPLQEQQMGSLPAERLTEGNAWEFVGVDYTGHFFVKGDQGEKKKVWILLFTDMVSRGIHLEVCEGMDTDSFFAAFRRCISRRGVPSKLFSDEARTFKRGQKELSALEKLASDERLLFKLQKVGTKWDLNVPHGQHRGGCWERLIRTIKENLRKVLGAAFVSLPVFATLCCELEANVNDRPLCPPFEDADSWDPITPAKLMVGRNLRALPNPPKAPPREPPTRADLRARWRQRNSIAIQSWNRFRKDYLLNVLPPLPKWTESRPSVNEGDLVLLSTEATSRGSWPLGRVTRVEPSIRRRQAGNVRTVEIRLSDGRLLRRPIQKIVRLELD